LCRKARQELADIKGQRINLVELSVSHHLMARALKAWVCANDIKVVNTSTRISSALKADSTAVDLNPTQRNHEDAQHSLVFDSSKIPGEIMT
jgi:NitT/TauT family transport system substrate-binding protein